MNQLEYVASGLNHSRITSSPALLDKSIVAYREALQHIDNKNNHRFSLLFNAFIESRFGEIFENYRDSIYHVHADSGGLQIITQGKTIDDSLRKQVYNVQGRYADISMSFDEIPLILEGEKSQRMATTGRYFDKENYEAHARKTGQNIHEQINTFLDMKSKSKPLIIVQGNCYNTYMKWLDLIYEEIPSHLHKHIGGIAVGAAALGTGLLEDIQRAFFVSQFENPSNHIHILGVGSLKRLIPYFVFVQNKAYDKNMTISYDSTTHTQGGSTSHYFFKDGQYTPLGKHYGPKYITAYNDANRYFNIQKQYGIDDKYFFDHFKTYSKHDQIQNENRQFDPEETVKFLMTTFSMIGSSILNFTSLVDKSYRNKEELISQSHKRKIAKDIGSLYSVKSKADFDFWLRHCGGQIHTSPIKSSKKEVRLF